MRYLFLTLPVSKAAKDKGLLGDPEKQDLKHKSYAVGKVLLKNNLLGTKRDGSIGSSASIKINGQSVRAES
jgi:hypothetical protein